jgi:hypothetical protein
MHCAHCLAQCRTQGITLFESGKVSLLRTSNGTVVADREWNTTDAKELFTYQNLTQPIISDELWQSMQRLPTGETASSNSYKSGGIDWSITYHRLQRYPDFVLVVSVDQGKALDTVQEVKEGMKSLRSDLSLYLVLTFLGVIVLTGLLAIFFIWRVTIPVRDVERLSKQVANNVGTTQNVLHDFETWKLRKRGRGQSAKVSEGVNAVLKAKLDEHVDRRFVQNNLRNADNAPWNVGVKKEEWHPSDADNASWNVGGED